MSDNDGDDPFCLKRYQVYLEQSREKFADCQRWYKWLSLIQLSLAHVLLVAAVFLMGTGAVLIFTGDCCHSTGEGMGYTRTNYYENGVRVNSSVEDHGCFCKCLGLCLRIAGLGVFLGGIGCVLGSMLMMLLSFMFLYESVNYSAPIEYFLIKQGEKYPKFLKRRSAMKKSSDYLGETNGFIHGQLVYTGWIFTTDKEWVHCNKMGKMVVDRYTDEQYMEYMKQRDLEKNANVQESNAAVEIIEVPVAVPVDKDQVAALKNAGSSRVVPPKSANIDEPNSKEVEINDAELSNNDETGGVGSDR